MKLFIDDLRNAPDSSWIIARTSNDANDIITRIGIPNHISFDHDLGGDDTAICVVNFIIEAVLDGLLRFPENFTFNVHSANPVGAANITGKMNGILNFMANR